MAERPSPENDICPVCYTKATIICKCPRRHRECASGHQWHWDKVGAVMDKGDPHEAC